ncbi:MAG: lipopolysaccharide biosynthesis protein [Enterococcus sp.]
MESSRTVNSIKNILTSLLSQVWILGLSMISRSFFLMYLSINYLGVNGLFSNILSLLTLADLGIGTAMNFSLYKPIHEKNQEEITMLMHYYRKVYLVIALVIALSGLLVVPFLPLIIDSPIPMDEIYIFYLIQLCASVSSYLFIYKATLLEANQKGYLINQIGIITQSIRIILQIGILILFQNYILYLLVMVVMEIIDNFWVSKVAEREYSFIKEKAAKLSTKKRKKIWKDIRSIFGYRMGGMVLNNTDDIFISAMVGTAYVGLYSNYMMIIATINQFISMFFRSITAAVGDKLTEEKDNDQFRLFQTLSFLCYWLVSFSAVALFSLLNDFLRLWLGPEYLFSWLDVFLICAWFAVSNSMTAVSTFREGSGLFHQLRYLFLVTAALNIVLCLIFGQYFGLTGILLSQVLCRIFTNMWYEPYILIHHYFKQPLFHYFIDICRFIPIIFGSAWLIQWLGSAVGVTGTVSQFIWKMILCICIPNGVMFLLFHRTKEWKDVLSYGKVLLHYVSKKR